MEYNQLTYIIEELKEFRKIHCKMMSKFCEEMTPEQGRLLHIIQKEKKSQKELAKILHITEATLSVRIKRLVDSGLVEREIDRNDKRVYTIVLSKKGEKLMNDIEESISYYQRLICRGITQEDYEAVLRVIHTIQNNLKEEIE